MILALFVAEHIVSAEGFLRDRLCPVCSAVSVTVTWRMSCSKTLLKTKGIAGPPCISVIIYFYRCNNTEAAAESSVSVLLLFPVNCMLLSSLPPPPRCLMRLVDDFLLITPDLHEAQSFLKYDSPTLSHISLFM